MEKFLVSEDQKYNILMMHKALLKEQKEDIIDEQSTTEIDNSKNIKILIDARDVGCLINGNIETKNNEVRYKARTKSGKIVYFYPDMTYKFAYGKTGKWKCSRSQQNIITKNEENDSKIKTLKLQNWKTLDELKKENVDLNNINNTHEKKVVGDTVLYREIGDKNVHYSGTSTTSFSEKQNSFIKKYTDLGYKLNPSRVEQMTMMPYSYKELGAPEDLFPNGLTLWYDPKTKEDDIEDVIGNIVKEQEEPAKKCKKIIHHYYTMFERRTSIIVDPASFNLTKNIVQKCKDQYYDKKWPWYIMGKKKLNNYLDILSADVAGGPSGEFEYFRIK